MKRLRITGDDSGSELFVDWDAPSGGLSTWTVPVRYGRTHLVFSDGSLILARFDHEWTILLERRGTAQLVSKEVVSGSEAQLVLEGEFGWMMKAWDFMPFRETA